MLVVFVRTNGSPLLVASDVGNGTRRGTTAARTGVGAVTGGVVVHAARTALHKTRMGNRVIELVMEVMVLYDVARTATSKIHRMRKSHPIRCVPCRGIRCNARRPTRLSKPPRARVNI